jgi:serine/threonine protein kinase
MEDKIEDNQIEKEKEKDESESEHKEPEPKENQKYIITNEKIGEGTFGDYYLAKDANDEKKLYAAKEINNKKESLATLEKEISLNREYEHENLVKFYGDYKQNDKLYLIFEYCNGGSLSSNYEKYFKKYGNPFSERIVQKVLKDIFKGLYYLHRNNIVHNDIKLGNILVQYNDENDKKNLNLYSAKYKISPSCLSKKCSYFPELFDSLEYLAPCKIEHIINEQNINNFSIDIWQCGILTFKILFNRNPFLYFSSKKEEEKIQKQPRDTMKLIMENFKKGDYYIDLIKEYCGEISKEILVLFSQILKKDQNARIPIEKCLKSKFIVRNVSKFTMISSKDFSEKLPSEMIENEKIKLNINDTNDLSSYTEFEEFKK